jgi:hypothetical protein
MKLLFHAVVFALGAGLGIWWGVNHPTQASIIASREDVAINKIKAGVAKATAVAVQTPATNPTNP